MTLEDVDFEGNQALSASGGAVSAQGGSEVLVTGCTLFGNRATGGGAVFGTGEETRVTVESSTLRGNVATKEGGALRGFALGHLRAERYVVCTPCTSALVCRGGGGARWLLCDPVFAVWGMVVGALLFERKDMFLGQGGRGGS